MKFTIPHNPVAKGRPRFTRKGFTYTPQKTRDFEELVRFYFLQAVKIPKPLKNAVEVKICFFLQIPKSCSQKKKKELENTWHTKKPDADNLAKAVCDSLNGLAWIDDSQICKITIEKRQSNFPRTEIEFFEIK